MLQERNLWPAHTRSTRFSKFTTTGKKALDCFVSHDKITKTRTGTLLGIGHPMGSGVASVMDMRGIYERSWSRPNVLWPATKTKARPLSRPSLIHFSSHWQASRAHCHSQWTRRVQGMAPHTAAGSSLVQTRSNLNHRVPHLRLRSQESSHPLTMDRHT